MGSTLAAMAGLWGLQVELPELPGVPTYQGRGMRRRLCARYGLPNAYPRAGETLFGGVRCLFVDDDRGGRPVAFWVPDPGEERRARA